MRSQPRLKIEHTSLSTMAGIGAVETASVALTAASTKTETDFNEELRMVIDFGRLLAEELHKS